MNEASDNLEDTIRESEYLRRRLTEITEKLDRLVREYAANPEKLKTGKEFTDLVQEALGIQSKLTKNVTTMSSQTVITSDTKQMINDRKKKLQQLENEMDQTLASL